MKKIFKFILYLLIIFIILITVATVLLFNMVDPTRIKEELTTRISEKTGRQVTILGNVERTIFPWLGLKINEMTVSNAPGFVPEDKFLTIGEAEIQVKVLPLFSGNIEIAGVNLKKVNLNLTRNASGKTNWEDLLKKDKADSSVNSEAENKNNKTHESSFFKSYSIAGIDVSQAQVTWTDEQKKQTLRLLDFHLKCSNIAANESFPLSIKFKLEGMDHFSGLYEFNTTVSFDQMQNHFEFVQLNMAANLQTSGFPSVMFNADKLVFDKTQQTLDTDDFMLSNGGLKAKGTLHVEQMMDNPVYTGSLELHTPDLKSFLKILGKNIQTTDPEVLKNFNFNTTFRGTNKSLKLDAISAELDGSHFTGHMNITSFTPKAIRLVLNIDQLNLDRYQSPATVTVETKVQTTAQNDETPVAVAVTTTQTSSPDFKFLRDMTLSADIKAGQLIVSAKELLQVHAQILLENSILKIAPLTANIYEGVTQGQLVADFRSTLPVYSINQNFANVQLNKLTSSDRLTGTANIGLQLNTKGLDKNSILGHLNGNMQFNIINGALLGVNIPYEIGRAIALVKKQTPPSAPENNQTDFGKFAGTGEIKNGIFTNRDLSMQSSDLKITGEGAANLITQNLNFHLRVVGMEAIKNETGDEVQQERQTPIPLLVTGTFSKPIVTPDVIALGTQLLKEQVQQNIKKNFENAKEKAGQLLQQLIK